MATKKYKPTTNARRNMTNRDFSEIQKTKPKKSLLAAKKKNAGRNNSGRITVRRRGGGEKRFYRVVDFKRNNATGVIESIEYDPNRSANIALVKLEDDEYAYILAGSNMKVGDNVSSGDEIEIKQGNRLPIESIPIGSFIYNIELEPGKGGQIARSAGTKCQLMAREDKYAYVRLPSSEVRLINKNCFATIGSVGNEVHQNVKYGKAGRKRRMGKRPSVRGVVMNAVDHPHGGGDGGSHGPGGIPKTPWGKKTLGLKTRKRKKTDKYIVRNRKVSKRRSK